jgi:glutathione synthase/RimK-type ligase-like ATP-grasp enzyme
MKFKLQLRTKNFSNKDLKGNIELPLRCLYRAGSTTSTKDCFPVSFGRRPIIEINTVDSIENSRSKLLMKACFAKAEVSQADWFGCVIKDDPNNKYVGIKYGDYDDPIEINYPILAKRINGFKGKGMVKIDDQDGLEKFLAETSANQLTGYYFEQFHNYSREYRIHCTQERVFMSWRKLRKEDTPDDRRWFFNSENCNWVGEDHELFDKPTNFDMICDDCVKAIIEVGLDIGSFDVRVQSSRKNNPNYILIEVNSAPSLGEKGIEIYKNELIRIFNNKTNN